MSKKSSVRSGRERRMPLPRTRLLRSSSGEGGDIAGWVMITVMTIMLAAAIMAIFTPAVTEYLQSALDQFM